MTTESTADAEIQMLRTDGQQAVATLFTKYEPQLTRMVSFRLDRRLFGRVDPADVLQDAFIEVSKRAHEFIDNPQTSFFVWARQLTWQTLLKVNRRHLQTQKRDASRELGFEIKDAACNTSLAIAHQISANITPPDQRVLRVERFNQLYSSLEKLDEMDREILAMRHFEYLTNNEVAEILGIQPTAASNRYIRAMGRLKSIMHEFVRDE